MNTMNALTWAEESPVHVKLEKLLVGWKMVCLDDSFSDEQSAFCNALPAHGHVYTVRAIRIAWGAHRTLDRVALMFEEIVNTQRVFGKEPAFRFTRFEEYESWLMRFEDDDSAGEEADSQRATGT